ncbi:MAG: hypothetical protein EON92_02385 [Burkholderiales bacterium]|nr:MAG: hypothetical protein EON92_02385 [Burkholderiales bacterium]
MGLPFAPIRRPEDLFDDPHLLASGGLGEVELESGVKTSLPILPLEMAGRRPTQGGNLPRAGEHTESILEQIGLTASDIQQMLAAGVISTSAK